MKQLRAICAAVLALHGAGSCAFEEAEDATIKAPIVMTVFPTSTPNESYVITISVDGVIETYLGSRRMQALWVQDVLGGLHYDDAADWYDVITAKAERDLDPDEIRTLNGLIEDVPFDDLPNQRDWGTDSWEISLYYNGGRYYVNNGQYYMYATENGFNPELALLAGKILEYSPIGIDLHGWI